MRLWSCHDRRGKGSVETGAIDSQPHDESTTEVSEAISVPRLGNVGVESGSARRDPSS